MTIHEPSVTLPSVASRVDAVTVFRRGALVTRVAEIGRSNGHFPAAVEIAGLPLAAADDSIRARVASVDGTGLPLAVRDLRVALGVPERIAEAPPDEEELKRLRRQEAALQARIEQCEGNLERLGKVQQPPRPDGREGEPPPVSPTASRLAFVDFLAGRERDLQQELLRLRAEERAIREVRLEAEDRLRRSSSDRRIEPHALRKSVVVRFDHGPAENGGNGDRGEIGPERVRLHLDYLVPGARWAPAYTLRLDPEGSGSELAMRALVAQRTGEDWDGVRLTLSTANAQRWAQLPELGSLRIGRRQPPSASLGWRPPPTGLEDLYRDWDRSYASHYRAKTRSVETTQKYDVEEMLAEAVASEEAGGGAEPPVGAVLEDLELGAVAAEPPPPAGEPVAAAAAPLSKGSARMRRASAEKMTGTLALDLAAADAAEATPGVRARDDMLTYGSLRMAPANAAGRGELVVCERVQLYAELLVEQHVELHLDVAQALLDAERRADSTGRRLPGRCRLAASDDGFDYAYPAESLAHIPSDRDFHSLGVLARPIEARLRHVVVPRESCDVFRIAELENGLPGPLLPGPADVYLGGQFLVTSEVPTTPAQGRVELGLGVEQAIKVARNTQFEEETKGITRGTLSLRHEIRVDAESHLPAPVQLEVRERVPTTNKEDPDVKVELGAVEPPWQSWSPAADGAADALAGGYRWRLGLEPGAKTKLRAEYRIRISSKHELVGGNRREH